MVDELGDEAKSPHPFARVRARFDCSANQLPNDGDHEKLLASFAERFDPNLIKLLCTLDFSLFELHPTAGRFVCGFGKAFDVNAAGTQFDPVVIEPARRKDLGRA